MFEFTAAVDFSGNYSSLKELQVRRKDSQAESKYIRKLSKQTPFSWSSVSLWFSFSLADHCIDFCGSETSFMSYSLSDIILLARQPASPPTATSSHSKESRCNAYFRSILIWPRVLPSVITINSFPHSSGYLIDLRLIQFICILILSAFSPQLMNRTSQTFNSIIRKLCCFLWP